MSEHDRKKMAPEEDFGEEVEFEQDGELGDIDAAKARVRKLKDELEKVKKERADYLDGWQRCKADSINLKKEMSQSAARSAELLREALVHDLIPVLDSFDMAAGSEAWEGVSDGFRSGMEHVRNQLIDALRAHGIERFGKIGEQFDPRIYEVAQEVSGVAGEQHEIVKILRYGYKAGDRILRPAQVIVKS